MTKSKLAAAVAASALVLTLGTAASALTTFTLSIGNAAISGFSPPYGSVSVTLADATHANISFTSATPQYFFLAAQAADVNVNAATWTLSGLTGNGGALSDGGSNNVDGFGVFNQTTDQFDGFGSRSSTISFTLTNTGGTWGSDSLVLKPNASGDSVGAHIGVCADAGCTSFVATGFATNGPGGAIPEPATWAMMLVGFFGMGSILRTQRRRALAA